MWSYFSFSQLHDIWRTSKKSRISISGLPPSWITQNCWGLYGLWSDFIQRKMHWTFTNFSGCYFSWSHRRDSGKPIVRSSIDHSAQHLLKGSALHCPLLSFEGCWPPGLQLFQSHVQAPPRYQSPQGHGVWYHTSVVSDLTVPFPVGEGECFPLGPGSFSFTILRIQDVWLYLSWDNGMYLLYFQEKLNLGPSGTLVLSCRGLHSVTRLP